MNTMNADTMIANVSKQANTNIASALFTKSFLLDLLNDALDYVYTYHNWSWNIITETITASGYAITLSYSAQNIFSVKDSLWNTYTQTELPWWWETKFTLQWNVIKFNKEVIWDIIITYRRWNKRYDLTNSSDYLDIPSWYNNIVRWLMLTDILPLWLWEWSWNLMISWYNRALDALNRKAKIDTYAEPKVKHTKAFK